MKYTAVVAGACMLLLDALIRVAFGVQISPVTVAWNCVAWLLWVGLVPAIVRVSSTVRYRRGKRLRFVLFNAMTMAALTAAQTSLYVLLRTLVRGMPGRPEEPLLNVLIDILPRHLNFGLYVYVETVLVTQSIFLLEALRRREEEQLSVERWLAQAELDLYQLQLPVERVNERLLEIERTIPHDAERAELLIEQFGASLRASLAAVNVHAAVDEIARDEDEVEELELEEFRPLSRPSWLLLLFSIVPAALVVINVVPFAAAVALRGSPLIATAKTGLLHISWAAVTYFPVTLALVWLGSRVRRMTVLAAAAIAVSFVWHLGLTTAQRGFDQVRQTLVPFGLFPDFLLSFGIALGALTYSRYRAWRARVVEVAQLESRILRTRSTLLRLQLNPHFLFNTLTSVAALLEEDTSASAKMTAQLREFVVRVLESSDRENMPLSEELDLLASYVAIQNVRFGGRVELSVQIDDDARRALVPGFLLQPLVENSLRHGLSPETGGSVSVQASVRDGALQIAVEDDGGADRADLLRPEGLGLSNTRARLAQIYGDGFVLDVRARNDGFSVTIGLPYRPARRLSEEANTNP